MGTKTAQKWVLSIEDDDGVEVNLEEFLENNKGLAPEEVEEIRALKPGQSFAGGSGEDPLWILERTE